MKSINAPGAANPPSYSAPATLAVPALHPTRRALFLRLCAMSILTGLGACAGLIGPHEVNVPLEKLQSSLERKFPFSARPLELIDIQLTEPRLALIPASNRMSATMNASVAPAFTQRIWRGTFTLSGTLELDAARHAVMLAQPRIDNIALEGVDPLVANQVARAAGVLAAQILRDSPLYTFGPDDFRYAGTPFAPTRIVTKSSGLVVTFEPVR